MLVQVLVMVVVRDSPVYEIVSHTATEDSHWFVVVIASHRIKVHDLETNRVDRLHTRRVRLNMLHHLLLFKMPSASYAREHCI